MADFGEKQVVFLMGAPLPAVAPLASDENTTNRIRLDTFTGQSWSPETTQALCFLFLWERNTL